MGKHRDRRTSEMWEPLSEHATFRLGIDYGFRNAFIETGPIPREEYEYYKFNSPRWSYGAAPHSYEEYLQLYDMYSKACRLRAAGLSETDAAEAVHNYNPPDLRALDEASFEKLGVHQELRGAFTRGRPLSQDEYEVFCVSLEPPKGLTPYDQYVRNWHYGEMGVGPPSYVEYMKQNIYSPPPYKDYLLLYKKYTKLSRA